MSQSVFARYEERGYPYRFAGRIHVDVLAGGTPTNPDVAESWLKTKISDKDLLIAAAVAEVMAERGVTEDVALEDVAKNRHLTGFKRDPEKGLYIEGRQLKACLKEAASVAADAGKISPRGHGVNNNRKGIISFLAEHVFVIEHRLYLGVDSPTDVTQSFVHTFRGNGIQYTEHVEDAEFDFTIESDKDFTEEEWANIWLTGERQGIGAARSQGFGRFEVVKWEQLPAARGAQHLPRRSRKAA